MATETFYQFAIFVANEVKSLNVSLAADQLATDFTNGVNALTRYGLAEPAKGYFYIIPSSIFALQYTIETTVVNTPKKKKVK